MAGRMKPCLMLSALFFPWKLVARVAVASQGVQRNLLTPRVAEGSGGGSEVVVFAKVFVVFVRRRVRILFLNLRSYVLRAMTWLQ